MASMILHIIHREGKTKHETQSDESVWGTEGQKLLESRIPTPSLSGKKKRDPKRQRSENNCVFMEIHFIYDVEQSQVKVIP